MVEPWAGPSIFGIHQVIPPWPANECTGIVHKRRQKHYVALLLDRCTVGRQTVVQSNRRACPFSVANGRASQPPIFGFGDACIPADENGLFKC